MKQWIGWALAATITINGVCTGLTASHAGSAGPTPAVASSKAKAQPPLVASKTVKNQKQPEKPASNGEAAVKQAASAYLQAVPPQELVDRVMGSLLKRVSAKDRATISRAVAQNLDMAKVQEAMLSTMVRHFTAEEIQAMKSFHETKTGRSIYQKTPEYTSDLVKTLMPVMIQAFTNAQKAQAEADNESAWPEAPNTTRNDRLDIDP